MLLLDAHHYLFQRPVVRDSIHSEDMLYAYTYADANTGAHAFSDIDSYGNSDTYAYCDADANSDAHAMSVGQVGYRL